MREKISAEQLLSNLVETLAAESNQKKEKILPFLFKDQADCGFSQQVKRRKSVHHLLGGGKSADVLLWRNKKTSASSFTGATAIWIVFEWLNCHLLTLVCSVAIFAMAAQFLWATTVSVLFDSRSSSKVPPPRLLLLPDELFVNIGRTIGVQINRALQFLQNASCGGNPKQFGYVVASLFAIAIIGSWCNFLTALYVCFIAAHSLPVLYEKNEDRVDDVISSALKQLRINTGKIHSRFLSKIPHMRGKKKEKKHD